MTKSSWLTAVITIAAAIVLGCTYAIAASQTQAPHYPTRTVWGGVYTEPQAAQGKLAYAQYCSRCHLDDLSGGEKAPALKGPAFFNRWHDLEVFDVFAKIQSAMPHDNAGFVPADTARDIVAFMLRENGIPAGSRALSTDIEEMSDILITPRPAAK